MTKEDKKEVKNDCKKCKYNGEKCMHDSNKGIAISYRIEKEVYFLKPEQLNVKGDCPNYAELSEE